MIEGGESLAELQEILMELVSETVGSGPTEATLLRLGGLLSLLGQFSYLRGRAQVLDLFSPIRASAPGRPVRWGSGADGLQEAMDELLQRRPDVGRDFRQVQQVYADWGFAMAKSTAGQVSDQVAMQRTRDAQKILGGGLSRSPDDLQASVQALGPWTAAYAETVQRTNSAGAFSAGQFEAAADPALGGVIAGFIFETVGDVDVRDDHSALDGIFAGVNDPIWDIIFPPVYYNCRCNARAVTRDEAEILGLVRPGEQADPASLPPGWDGDFFPGGRPGAGSHGI